MATVRGYRWPRTTGAGFQLTTTPHRILTRSSSASLRLEPERAAGEVDGFSPAALESRISLKVSIPDHRAMALLDVDRCSQVVANLVENGLCYARSRLHVQLTDDVGGIELRVHDDGPGVPADDLPHVFEWLYASKHRPDDRESGSGLGLVIVREIVHAMGGSVWAESAPGSGAALIVRIPRMWASAGEE